jgi:HNH endonuclease
MTTVALEDLPERFRSKVSVNEQTGCWEWTAATRHGGYGNHWGGVSTGKFLAAHRYSYETLVGPIPDGLQLDHLCRVRGCVNPEHLEPVTCRENLLRGETFTAKNAGKTHCPAGHEYESDNVNLSAKGQRHCRACRSERYNQERTENGYGLSNSVRTHCPQGHPYSGDNLLVSGGKRHCRACKRAREALKRKQ